MPLHLQFDPFHGRHPPAPSEGTSCSTCSGRTSSHTAPARPRMDRWRWCTIRGTCHVRRHSPGFLGRSDGTDPSIRPRRTREDLLLRELRERRVRSVVSSRPRTPGETVDFPWTIRNVGFISRPWPRSTRLLCGARRRTTSQEARHETAAGVEGDACVLSRVLVRRGGVAKRIGNVAGRVFPWKVQERDGRSLLVPLIHARCKDPLFQGREDKGCKAQIVHAMDLLPWKRSKRHLPTPDTLENARMKPKGGLVQMCAPPAHR